MSSSLVTTVGEAVPKQVRAWAIGRSKSSERRLSMSTSFFVTGLASWKLKSFSKIMIMVWPQLPMISYLA